MPKVSIIVPIYNIKDYLKWSIESLIRQTENDIEIILVDDGSTDESGNLCDQYSKIDSRIKTIHKKNGGLSSARNAGVKEATSEYVLFLDGDDYLCDDAIETLLIAINNYEPDIVQFLYKEVKESGTQKFHEIENWTPFVTDRPIDLFTNLYKFGGVAASGCTKLIRRKIIEEHPFESIRHEDEMWCTRVFPIGVKIVYIPDILYFYVMREGSIIHSKFSEQQLDKFIINEKRIEVLEKLHLTNFINIEYKKMFLTIIDLYSLAHKDKNMKAMLYIKNVFKNNKHNFYKANNFETKYKILLSSMCLNYNFIYVYMYFKKFHG